MFESGLFPLGILLFFIGVAFFLVAFGFLRVIPKIRPKSRNQKQHSIAPDIGTHNDAVLIVKAGGRISYINDETRNWFNLKDDDPNLENMARNIHPSDNFLGLCASAGHTRFSLNGQWVEGTSYFLPGQDEGSILVSLHHQDPLPVRREEAQFSNQTLEILTQLSLSMAKDLDLETTLQSILSSVEQLIPPDFAEITIWNPNKQWLIPYRFVGVKGLDLHLEKTDDRYTIGVGYSGYLAKTLEPLLIENVDEYQEIRPIIDRRKFPFMSYLGYPLIMGGELIGTVELASQAPNAFSDNDLELLRLLSGQAAIALHNAILFQDEQRRADELSNLANLTHAVSKTRDSQDLFNHLVQGISSLLDIEIIGFLTYNHLTRKLEAQQPFVGVPPNFVDLYRISIPQDSPAERVWEQQETIIATIATEDQRLIDLGIDHMARAAGIKDTVLIPLTSSGRSLGYLQVANKRGDVFFDQDDHRILSIVAGQAAQMIENADLIQQSINRALRAEALRRIASLAGSTTELNEIIKNSILELVQLFKVDIAAVFLLDENLGELRVHVESLYGFGRDSIRKLGRINANDLEFHNTVTRSKQPCLITNVDEDLEIPAIYSGFIADHQIKSALIVPIILRENSLGEMMLASKQPELFTQNDIQLANTVASQFSLAIERSSLETQTDTDLRKRVEQLTALTRISRELNTSLDLGHLLQRVYEESIQTTHSDCGTIMLFPLLEDRVDTKSITAHFGETPGSERHPLETIVLESGKAIMVNDFTQPAPKDLKFAWSPPHPDIKSTLIIPIAYQENITGLIVLHSKTAGIYDQAALDIVQALSVQAAIAVGNAQRYQDQVQQAVQLSHQLDTLSNIFEATRSLHLDQPLEKILEDIAYGIQTSTPFDMVLISVFNRQDKYLNRVANAGLPLEKMQELKSHPQQWENYRKLMDENFQFGRSYFIPSDQRPEMPESWHAVTVFEGKPQSDNENAWDPQDILIIPLTKPDGQPLGLISVDAPRNNLRPDKSTIETLEIFANQAALAIESQQNTAELQFKVDHLEEKLGQIDTIQKNYPEIVSRNQSQKAAIERMEQNFQRTTAGLRIIETINVQSNRQEAYASLAEKLREQLGLDIAVIAESSPTGPHIVLIDGEIPTGVNPRALFGQRNPLHQTIQSGEVVLINDIEQSEDWQQSPLLNALDTKSLICLPITLATGWRAAVLGIDHRKSALYSQQDIQLFELISKQISAEFNNLELLSETGQRLQDVNILLNFSQRLGGLDTDLILETFIESAIEVIPSADAGAVIFWDAISNHLIPLATKGYRNEEAILKVVFSPEETVTGKVYKEGSSIRLDEVDFAKDFNLVLDNLLNYRDATGGKLPRSSMLVPIKSSENSFGVIILDNFNTSKAFSGEDQTLIESLARQTALTIENAQLLQSAEKRTAQLQALSNVAATITSRLQPEVLIDSLLDSLSPVVPYDTGTLWIPDGADLTIQSKRPVVDNDHQDMGSISIEDNHLFREIIKTGQSISIDNISMDDRFPESETSQKSWLGVPMLAKGEVTGVIALEKEETGFYTLENIQAATTFANQAAVALENATLYQQSLQRTQRLALLNRFSNRISSTLEPDKLIHITLEELQQAVPETMISAVLFDAGEFTLQAELPKVSDDLPMILPAAPVFENLRESLGIFHASEIQKEENIAPLWEFLATRQTKSILILPIGISDSFFGFILLHSQQPNRFTPDEIDLGSIMTNQASVAIQNASLYAKTRRLTEELEQRVAERTEQLRHQHHRTQTLLQIMQELASSLDLDQVLNRTLALLNETIGAQQSTILLVHPEENKFVYRASLGYATAPTIGESSSANLLDEGLAGWVISHRKGILIEDITTDEHWSQLDVEFMNNRSAMAVPLLVGGEILGSMLLFHPQANKFTHEHRELVQAAAHQIAIAINNNELFSLIREQAESLGSMLRTQQIETSRSTAILEAVADGVLVTDSQNTITLFNQSAQQILGLKRESIVGNSLDNFSGLFGAAARSWTETINHWAKDSSSISTGDTYAERITIDNLRVVFIHLAPVVLRDEFLGTVSIFRDITHQVAVDRLKSEFVATVSHELRTPMTSIKGYVDVLLMGAAGDLSEQQTAFLKVVQSNTERLNILVNDLLDVSRIEAGKVTLSIQPLNIAEIARDIIEEQLRRSEEDTKPMQINLEIEPGFPRVPGDPERVRQILDNLVNNAFNYTHPNGQITVHLHIEGNEAQIDVKDNGIGIPPEDSKRIFERFYRGEDPLVLATSGNGLGLPITQQLVEMHHGRIWMKSNGVPGDGSVFSFTLPLQNWHEN